MLLTVISHPTAHSPIDGEEPEPVIIYRQASQVLVAESRLWCDEESDGSDDGEPAVAEPDGGDEEDAGAKLLRLLREQDSEPQLADFHMRQLKTERGADKLGLWQRPPGRLSPLRVRVVASHPTLSKEPVCLLDTADNDWHCSELGYILGFDEFDDGDDSRIRIGYTLVQGMEGEHPDAWRCSIKLLFSDAPASSKFSKSHLTALSSVRLCFHFGELLCPEDKASEANHDGMVMAYGVFLPALYLNFLHQASHHDQEQSRLQHMNDEGHHSGQPAASGGTAATISNDMLPDAIQHAAPPTGASAFSGLRRGFLLGGY